MNDNFTYNFPNDFKEKIVDYAEQKRYRKIAELLERCSFRHVVLGFALKEDMKGEVWNKKAIILKVSCDEFDAKQIMYYKKQIIKLSHVVIEPNISGFLVKDILIDSVINNPIIPEDKRTKKVLNESLDILGELIEVAKGLSANATYDYSVTENQINDYMRDSLGNRGAYDIADQSRYGVSQSQLEAGEVDLLFKKNSKATGLCEGLRLNSLNRRYISSHIDKVIGPYNPNGLPSFLLMYVCLKDFDDFWNKFRDFILGYNYSVVNQVRKKSETEDLPLQCASIKIMRQFISKNSYKFPIYFMAIKLSEVRKK